MSGGHRAGPRARYPTVPVGCCRPSYFVLRNSSFVLRVHLVVVGNGIAGITAARLVRKRDPATKITVVSDEGAHPYARTALMYVYMGHLTLGQTKLYEDGFWARSRIALVRDHVEQVEADAKRLVLRDGAPLAYDRLLVATGSVPALPNWPGRGLDGVQGLYGLPDLAAMERDTAGVRHAVVVGGGLIGVELAEMLRVRGIGVTMLVREGSYYASAMPPEEGRIIEREICRHGVDLRLKTEVREVLGDDRGRVHAVVTTAGEEIPAAWVGVGTGVRPNVGWLEGSGIEVGRGVLVDECLRASAPGVFSAGDCAELRNPPPGRRPIEPLWYVARAQGAAVAGTITGTPTPYRPGPFFNSAKFFDLEWQLYGRIDPAPPDGEGALVWDTGRRLVRVQHEATGVRRVVGFDALGVRLRQDVCADWLTRGAGLDEATKNFGAAVFDPEFHRDVAPAVAAVHDGVTRPLRRGWPRWMAALPARR